MEENKKKMTRGEILGFIWQVFFKILIVLLVIVILAVFALASVCKTVADGPSESARDMLVLSALQASATKWVPGLFWMMKRCRQSLIKAEKE